MAYITLAVTLLVSFVGFVYMDNRQQEVRLSVVEHHVEELTMRMNRVVEMVLRKQRLTPQESYEQEGP